MAVKENAPEYTLKALDTVSDVLKKSKNEAVADIGKQLSKYVDSNRDKIKDEDKISVTDIVPKLADMYGKIYKELIGKYPKISVSVYLSSKYKGPGNNSSMMIYRAILVILLNIAITLKSNELGDKSILKLLDPDLREARTPEVVMAITNILSKDKADDIRTSTERLLKLSKE